MPQDHEMLQQQFRELLAKAQENQTILERFQQFELAMLSASEFDDLLNQLLYRAIRHFDLSDCRLIWFDRQLSMRSLVEEQVRQQFGHRLVFSSLAVDIENLFGEAKKPILSVLSPMDKLHWFPGKTHVLSAAFIPLFSGGNLSGCYLLGSPDAGRFTTDKAVDFIGHMGLIAGMCLQNMAIREQVRLLGMMDGLTQVKNRRCFDIDISKEVSRAQRSGRPLSCLFIDADHFKSINDTHGHQAGDEVLRSLAAWAGTQLREGDMLARYGGEEFAVLLPDCDESLACQVAERIRQHVGSSVVNVEGVEIRITLSLGVSTYDPTLDPARPKEAVVSALLAEADAAVYVAKQSGRNRVVVRGTPVTEREKERIVQ